MINGEPTGNRLASGQKGALQLHLSCLGRRCHSSLEPTDGHALWSLFDWLDRLRALTPSTHLVFGRETWNLGSVEGGEAGNVVPGHAEARLFVRTVPGSTFEDDCRRLAPEGGVVELLASTEPEVLDTVEGFEVRPVAFGSDAPRLRSLLADPERGSVLMVGPGSIEQAHADDEWLDLAELGAGVESIEALGRRLLAVDGATAGGGER